MLNGTGKLDRFFETAVGDFHLMISKALFVESVATTAADSQERAHYLNFELIEANTGKIELYDPAITGFVDISCRIPETFGGTNLPVHG